MRDAASSEEESESEAEEEEEPAPRKRQAPAKKSPGQGVAAASARAAKTPRGKGRRAGRGAAAKAAGGGAAPPTRRQAVQALKTLASKFIQDPDKETEENSLVAALLSSYKDGDDSSASAKNKKRGGGGSSFYTAGLQSVARRVVQQYGDDPNGTDVQLFNLILRSAGAESVLDPEKDDLESMTDDDFADLMENAISEMEDVAADRIPFTANTAKLTVAQAEYRKIFEEFWFRLAETALTDSAATSGGDRQPDGGGGSERFRVEVARDLVTHMAELLTLGIPDVRMGLVTAVYQMSLAMLERTVEVQGKLATAERQLTVARRSKQQRKAEALAKQMGSWKRTVDDLEAFVTDMVVSTVIVKRYRDRCEFIRVATLEALTQFCTVRPDLFVSNMYLKYFGWMLSDEVPAVRVAAIKGLLVPLEKEEVDAELMDKVLLKFSSRLTDMTTDVDSQVQEAALTLLLKLLRNDFFDNVEDDRLWEQINFRSLDPDTTPQVRRDALHFVLEQLEAFDSGTAKTEREAVEQLSTLAQWYVATCLSSSISFSPRRFSHLFRLSCDHSTGLPERFPIVISRLNTWSLIERILSCRLSEACPSTSPSLRTGPPCSAPSRARRNETASRRPTCAWIPPSSGFCFACLLPPSGWRCPMLRPKAPPLWTRCCSKLRRPTKIRW